MSTKSVVFVSGVLFSLAGRPEPAALIEVEADAGRIGSKQAPADVRGRLRLANDDDAAAEVLHHDLRPRRARRQDSRAGQDRHDHPGLKAHVRRLQFHSLGRPQPLQDCAVSTGELEAAETGVGGDQPVERIARPRLLGGVLEPLEGRRLIDLPAIAVDDAAQARFAGAAVRFRRASATRAASRATPAGATSIGRARARGDDSDPAR